MDKTIKSIAKVWYLRHLGHDQPLSLVDDINFIEINVNTFIIFTHVDKIWFCIKDIYLVISVHKVFNEQVKNIN